MRRVLGRLVRWLWEKGKEEAEKELERQREKKEREGPYQFPK